MEMGRADPSCSLALFASRPVSAAANVDHHSLAFGLKLSRCDLPARSLKASISIRDLLYLSALQLDLSGRLVAPAAQQVAAAGGASTGWFLLANKLVSPARKEVV